MNVKIDITGKNVTTQTSSDKVNDSKEGTELLYKRYCECRDQELERFWKNSIYLWTFLAICFTGYGFLLSSYLGKDAMCNPKLESYFPLISFVICVFGIILSYLWLRIAKALKISFETFEMAIWEMECFDNIYECNSKYLIHNFWTSKENDRSSSPTQIAVLTGYISVAFWCLVLLVSLYISYEPTVKSVVTNIYFTLSSNDNNVGRYDCITLEKIICFCLQYAFVTSAAICVAILCIMFVVSRLLKSRIESKRIRTKDENDVFKSIRQFLNINETNKTEIPYFEIADNTITFMFKNKAQFYKWNNIIKNQFDFANFKDYKDKLLITIDYRKVKKNCKFTSGTNSTQEHSFVQSIMEKMKKFQPEVNIYNQSVYIRTQGCDFRKDMNDITEILDALMTKQTQYSNYLVTYNLNHNK